jgi:hypothetical protein
MSQSTVTVGALILAFLIYTTMKGNLSGYMKVLGIA